MNPLRTLLSIFTHPLHAFMSQGRIYVYVSDGPHLENRQPFHDFIFGTRQFRQPLQGRRISRVPQTTVKEKQTSGHNILHLPHLTMLQKLAIPPFRNVETQGSFPKFETMCAPAAESATSEPPWSTTWATNPISVYSRKFIRDTQATIIIIEIVYK